MNSLYIENDSIDSFAGANEGTSYSKDYMVTDTDIYIVVRALFKYNEEYFIVNYDIAEAHSHNYYIILIAVGGVVMLLVIIVITVILIKKGKINTVSDNTIEGRMLSDKNLEEIKE